MGWLYKTKDFLCNCYIQPWGYSECKYAYRLSFLKPLKRQVFHFYFILHNLLMPTPDLHFFSLFLFCFIGHLIVVLSLMLDYHLTSEKRNCFSASTPNNSFGMFWWYITVCATLGFLIDCLCTNVVGFFLFLFL